MRFGKIIPYTLVIGILFGACKAKKAVAEGEVDTSLSTKRIIQSHYENALDFTTLSGKVKIDYREGDKNQGVTVSLRMKKDEAIWVSAPLGLFKAFITPERVSFYNKLEGEYFDGDFSFLSDLLGYTMDFDKVQNLLIGNTVLDLRQEKYISYYEKEGYGLKPKAEQELFKILFSLEPRHFRVGEQHISQPEKDRFLKMVYGYQNLDQKVAPSSISIQAVNEGYVRNIDLDFRNIEFGRNLNFPYKIPKGYKTIVAR